MTMCSIAFRQVNPSIHFNGEMTEWLVELTAIEHADVSVVVIVRARCFDEAVSNAFFTRNIASSWIVTEVEEA